MNVMRLSLRDGPPVDVGVIGPDSGHPVLYFHSPATSGEELRDAGSVADQLHLRLVTLKRPSIVGDDPTRFIDAVATNTAAVIDALSLDRPVLLAWSGGAPYALAAAALLGSAVESVHLVSPVPGELNGPNAISDQTERLREVAETTPTSPWATDASTRRDYRALASPWPFSINSLAQPVTIWAPRGDEIVPPRLVDQLAGQMRNNRVLEVSGAHDWFRQNWSMVLERIAEARPTAPNRSSRPG